MNATVHLLYESLKLNQASHCVIIESSSKMLKDCLTGKETSFTIVRIDILIYFALFFRLSVSRQTRTMAKFAPINLSCGIADLDPTGI